MHSTSAVSVTPGSLNLADKINVNANIHLSSTVDEKKESPSATGELDHSSTYNIQSSTQRGNNTDQQPYGSTTVSQYHIPYIDQYTAAPHVVAGIVPPQQVYIQQQGQLLQQAQLPLEAQFQSLGLESNTNQVHLVSDNNERFTTDTTFELKKEETGVENTLKSPDGYAAEIEENTKSEGSDEETNNANDGKEEPVKLFVGQVPKTMNEEDVFPTFDSFGPLKDVSIIRDKQTQLHRGCAFVTYWSPTDAEKAQEALHGKHVFPGARRPAQVKPAETLVTENKLFIGMLSRTAGEDEIRELFAPFGEIREIYMIRNADGSSKCAAFIRYVERDSAIQAIENLHNNLVMEGAGRPLIVKFADTKQQRAQRHMRNVRRQELMTVMGPGAAYPGAYSHVMGLTTPNGGPSPYPPHHMGGPSHHLPQYGSPYTSGPGAGGPPIFNPMYPPHYGGVGHHHPYGAAYRQGSHNRGHVNGQANNPRPREGPAGANLFVYHLPHDLTDADLATAFNDFGNVISAKVYVDRYTGESKGFGFVSYDSVISAEGAIEAMNGFQIGNKRLKVQHKRVHNNNGGGRGSGKNVPQMIHHELNQQQTAQQPPQQQQQQHQGNNLKSQSPDESPTSQIGDKGTSSPVVQ